MKRLALLVFAAIVGIGVTLAALEAAAHQRAPQAAAAQRLA